MVEILTCIKDQELGEVRVQRVVENQEFEDSYKSLWLDQDEYASMLIKG